jgi:hypothetical protein
MKINTFFKILTILAAASGISAKSLQNSTHNFNLFDTSIIKNNSTISNVSNVPTLSNETSSESVAYALGSNGGYTLKNDLNYKTPKMVEKLVPSPVYEQDPGAKAVADEVPSITHYYDGRNKLNTIKVTCKIYVNKVDCLHKDGCGWCGATSGCVQGNQMGPMEACAASTYIFTTGAVHQDERVIRENIGGLTMTVVSK